MPAPGNTIGITLTVGQAGVSEVAVTGRDLRGLAEVFAGMPAAEVPARIGGIYSLCGRAQTIAALQAIEAATVIDVPAGVQAARDALRLAEMLTQTAMRLALHWPAALDRPTRPDLVRDCLMAEAQLEAALFEGAQWQTPGAGLTGSGDAAREGFAALSRKLETAIPALGLKEAIQTLGLASFGTLPDEVTPEQGAFTRHWNAPGVVRARQGDGPGLAARLAASEADLAALPPQILSALDRIAPLAPAAPVVAGRATGAGCAIVETARGPLRHEAQVRDGRVAAYAIDAPTEVNLRPNGPLDQGLLQAPPDGLEQAAALHVLAIDPCVEFTVEVRHA